LKINVTWFPLLQRIIFILKEEKKKEKKKKVHGDLHYIEVYSSCFSMGSFQAFADTFSL